jgi:nucleotide sugar dehydrogenase
MKTPDPANNVARSTASRGPAHLHSLPTEAESRAAFAHIREQALAHRAAGRRIVVVQGLGFVGAAVAAVVAGARDPAGAPLHVVIGVDRPGADSYWKVVAINAGRPPIAAPDPELAELTADAVLGSRLFATTCDEAYEIADVIIVDVHLDAANRARGVGTDIEVGLASFRAAIETVGRGMRPDALVLIETTVPVGTCAEVAEPILREERRRRGITTPLKLAHAYERVMPGPRYVDSIRSYWRSYAGIDNASAHAAEEFLSTFIDTEVAPLWQLADTTSSELGKLLENSYRALNIAFMHEWTLLAESVGVNLFEVVDAIRVRKGTHDNMRYPGFGVGGYCLTKDSLLAQWGAEHLLGSDVNLSMTLAALDINYRMPHHTLDLLDRATGNNLRGVTVSLLGVSYLADVGDTRNSPAEMLCDELLTAGAVVRAHDPYVDEWRERPHVPLVRDLDLALRETHAIVMAVPHSEYRRLSPEQITAAVGHPAVLVDAQNVITDASARALREAGWRLIGVGKGHWLTAGYHLAP